MNHIELHIEGKTYGKAGSGFAVILKSKTSEWKRSFAYGNYSANQAELLAAKFAILSISRSFADLPIKLFAKNKYVREMLERDENRHYIKRVSANKEFVQGVRDLIEDKEIEILKSEGDTAKEVSSMVEAAVKDDSPIDERK